MIEIIFNNVLPYIVIAIGFLVLLLFYRKNIQMVIYTKQKNNKLLKLSKFLHRYYNLFFIILFIISLLLFRGIYFTHTNNVEKRFDNALKSYEQSLSNIFNNLSMKTNNYTNESTVSNTSSSCTSTRDRISINNNNIMNMIRSEEDGFDELKKSFEIGLDLLKASLSEIMKNSNDVLTFWFAFLSIIMVVFSFTGYFINNNILEQSKTQLDIVETKSNKLIEKLKKKTKIEIEKLTDENNLNTEIYQLFALSEKSVSNKDYNLSIYYNNEIIKLYKTYFDIKDLKYKKNYSTAYYNIGLSKYNIKEYSDALKYFNKAIKLNPNFSEPYNNIGLIYFNIGEYDNSIIYFNNAIDLNNQNSIIYVNRGIAKYKLEDYKGSLEDYNKAIELNNYSSEAYNNRGNTQMILNNKEEALNDYNKAIELNTNNSKAYNDRGLLKKQLKDYEGALNDFNKAIEIKPNFAEVYNNRGILNKACLNKLDNSLSDFNKAIELNPNYSEAYFNRGLLKSQLKDYKGSLEDYNKAIELNPKYSEAYLNRYISKSLLLAKIVDKNSEEYKKAFDDAYNDLDTAYSLADDKLKETIKNQVIDMAKEGNDIAIKFCDDKDWEIKI